MEICLFRLKGFTLMTDHLWELYYAYNMSSVSLDEKTVNALR